MDEQQQVLPEEEKQEKPKSQWQQTKEGWYDKIPLNLKQLDLIVYCCYGALILLAIVIALDAMGIISPFG